MPFRCCRPDMLCLVMLSIPLAFCQLALTSQEGNKLRQHCQVDIRPTTTAKPIQTYGSRIGSINQIVFGHEKRLIACGSTEGVIALVDINSGKSVTSLAEREQTHQGWITGIAFSPGDNYLATTAMHDDKVIVWNTRTGRIHQIYSWRGFGFEDVAFSPDGKTLAAAGYKQIALSGEMYTSGIRLWTVDSVKLVAAVHAKEDSIRSFAFSPCGRKLAIGRYRSEPIVWDLVARRVLAKTQTHDRPLTRIRYSPRGRLLATCGMDAKVKIWNVKKLWKSNPARGHGRVSIVRKGATPDRVLSSCRDTVMNVAWSPDGKYLAMASICNGDQSEKLSNISIWDVASGIEVVNLGSGRIGYCGGAVAFSPDGKYLATGHSNGDLKLWSVSILLRQSKGLRDRN